MIPAADKPHVDQFVREGVVVVPRAINPTTAESWVREAFARLEIDEHDPATWAGKNGLQARTHETPLAEIAPTAWAVICDLLGGADAIDPRTAIAHDGFNLNSDRGADEPWQPPSAAAGGWHKDGWFFKHFLDSPEQALLVLMIWRDIEPRSGGTFYAPDSIPLVIRDLAKHPEGVEPGHPFAACIGDCRDFREVTAKAGDIVIMHPYTLHAPSRNPSGRIRVMNNKVISLKEPLRFDRPNGQYTPLERTFLNALGVDRYPFAITGERERDPDFGPLSKYRERQAAAAAK